MSSSTKSMLVDFAIPNAPLSEKMEYYNTLDDTPEFPPSDIAYAKFLENVNDSYAYNCVVIAGLLTYGHMLLHIEVQCLKKRLNAKEKNSIKVLYNALISNNMELLLTEGLDEFTMDVLEGCL